MNFNQKVFALSAMLFLRFIKTEIYVTRQGFRGQKTQQKIFLEVDLITRLGY